MKSILLHITIFSACLFAHGQDTIKFQYDSFFVDSHKITSKITYLNNNAFSNEEYYYENGNIYLECTRINGEFNGIFKKYYSNGQLKESFYYVVGFPAGDWFEFYENGNIAYHGSYLYAPDRLVYKREFGDTLIMESDELVIKVNISEYKDGCWKFYFPNGKIERIEYYSEGMPVNTWYYYDIHGILTEEIQY